MKTLSANAVSSTACAWATLALAWTAPITSATIDAYRVGRRTAARAESGAEPRNFRVALRITGSPSVVRPLVRSGIARVDSINMHPSTCTVHQVSLWLSGSHGQTGSNAGVCRSHTQGASNAVTPTINVWSARRAEKIGVWVALSRNHRGDDLGANHTVRDAVSAETGQRVAVVRAHNPVDDRQSGR